MNWNGKVETREDESKGYGRENNNMDGDEASSHWTSGKNKKDEYGASSYWQSGDNNNKGVNEAISFYKISANETNSSRKGF
jgi:hypothetical protein